MNMIKKTVFIFLYLYMGIQYILAADHYEDKENENKRIVTFLKTNHNLDFENVTVRESAVGWWWKTSIDRPLQDKDLHSTAIRGFLIGFSHGFFDHLEIFFHNISLH